MKSSFGRATGIWNIYVPNHLTCERKNIQIYQEISQFLSFSLSIIPLSIALSGKEQEKTLHLNGDGYKIQSTPAHFYIM